MSETHKQPEVDATGSRLRIIPAAILVIFGGFLAVLHTCIAVAFGFAPLPPEAAPLPQFIGGSVVMTAVGILWVDSGRRFRRKQWCLALLLDMGSEWSPLWCLAGIRQIALTQSAMP